MISREDAIQQSVQDHLRTYLYGPPFNYPQNRVEITEGFNYDLLDEKYGEGLPLTLIGVAFTFDNGGRQMEMGSSLTEYLHTIDFLILGHTPTWGRNVANVVKSIFRTESGSIPLFDYSSPQKREIDRLEIEDVRVDREPVAQPRPWQQHAWTTRLRVRDETYAALAV